MIKLGSTLSIEDKFPKNSAQIVTLNKEEKTSNSPVSHKKTVEVIRSMNFSLYCRHEEGNV